MAEPFLSEIKIVGFNFAPKGWALANGQIMGIAQNQALFSLVGTTYGGNGMTTFGLPNLQGAAPMHNTTQGIVSGTANVTLAPNQIPQHTHLVMASNKDGNTPNPSNNVLASTAAANLYTPAPTPAANAVALNAAATSAYGGSQPHSNMMPYLVLNFVIALQGIFPPRS